MIIEGSVSSGLTFRHADGSLYGQAVSAASADNAAKAFQALRGIGFGERDVRRALEHASRVAGILASVDAFVRHGLLSLTEGHARA